MKTVELREKALALSDEVLADIVHDIKSDEAAVINNAGKESQIEFIILTGQAPYLQKVLEEETDGD